MANTSSKTGDIDRKAVCKPRFAPKAEQFQRLLKESAQSRMPSAAQIRALNETLQLLIVFVILFEDWPTRLIAIIALILIHRRSKMT